MSHDLICLQVMDACRPYTSMKTKPVAKPRK